MANEKKSSKPAGEKKQRKIGSVVLFEVQAVSDDDKSLTVYVPVSTFPNTRAAMNHVAGTGEDGKTYSVARILGNPVTVRSVAQRVLEQVK